MYQLNEVSKLVSGCLKQLCWGRRGGYQAQKKELPKENLLACSSQAPIGLQKRPTYNGALLTRAPGDPLWVAYPPSRKDLGASTACGRRAEKASH